MIKKLLGYTDKLTVRPGDNIEFKVSSDDNQPFTAQLVQLINGDIHSESPGFKEVEISATVNREYAGREQAIIQGSCIVIEDIEPLLALQEFSLALNFMPTTPALARQHIISHWNQCGDIGWSLQLNKQGQLAFITKDSKGGVTAAVVEQCLKAKCWYRATLRVSWIQNTVNVCCSPIESASAVPNKSVDVSNMIKGERPWVSTPLLIAAAFGGRDNIERIAPVDTFNGRIESPVIYQGLLDDAELIAAAAGLRPSHLNRRLVANWDFTQGIGSTLIKDTSLNALNGYTHNLPLRALKGTQWDGTTMRWSEAREQYGAIHFHRDDLYDCGWLTDVHLRIPDNWASGIYALRLRLNAKPVSVATEEYLPFFVTPPKGKPQAKLAFIVPTFTYMAYGNIHLASVAELEAARQASELSDKEFFNTYICGPGSKDYIELMEGTESIGKAVYNFHSDGSPIHFSSCLRPLLNIRPKNNFWNFTSDLLYIAWLEAKQIEYDIITDDLLHKEGTRLLKNYSVIMSGSHPEYVTTKQLDAIRAYTEQGGRFMYMGGNGYYWRCAVHTTLPGVIEVRRGRAGMGDWYSEVGECYHEFTGEKGGIWKEIGRPPQQLFGVAYIGQGINCRSQFYRIAPGVRESRAAFIVDGIDEEIVGDFGVIGGGAAGQEIDKSNSELGTPEHAIVIAQSENHGSDMVCAIEERPHVTTDAVCQRETYAQILFFETAQGGAVFSVGSMTWCGSLSHNNYNNSISTMTANVLKRFCDPAPLQVAPVD